MQNYFVTQLVADVVKNVASEDANASDEDAPPGNADARD